MATNKLQLILVIDGYDANGDEGIDYANSGATTAAMFRAGRSLAPAAGQ